MFKIGDFSKLGQVSVRMLRHYDQLGLLYADQIDTFTGYRYYAVEQLARLNRIIFFKDLGFSLKQIKELLDNNPPSYKKIHNLLDAPSPRYTVQMWARLGYGPQIEPAPRRGLEAHIAKS